MQDINLTRHFLVRSLALAGGIALVATFLVLGSTWGEKPEPKGDPTLGSRAEQLSPTARQDLELVYHQAWQYVRDSYVNPDDLKNWGEWEHKYDGKLKTERQLVEALREMLASVSDKRTHYTTRKTIRDFEQSVSGKVIGIGVSLNDEYKIVSVIYGKPAQRAGVATGDMIIAVDKTPVTGLTQKQVVELIRGENIEGTKVVLWVVRDQKVMSFELTREVVQTTDAVRSTTMWGSYFDPVEGNSIRIDNLRSDNVVAEFQNKVDDFNKKGVRSLVLDLRGLNGGSGETAARVAAMFMDSGVIARASERVDGVTETTVYELKGGKLVVTRSQPGKPDTTAELNASVNVFKGTVVVLTDDSTSGAAEVIAAALKDNGRAEVVGIKTAGKDVGQRSFYLSKTHALRISTVRYYRPGGAGLAGGLEPNVLVPEADRAWIFERGMTHLKKITPPPAPKPKEQ